eukprot:2196340-Rhodomonas_salina.1
MSTPLFVSTVITLHLSHHYCSTLRHRVQESTVSVHLVPGTHLIWGAGSTGVRCTSLPAPELIALLRGPPRSACT